MCERANINRERKSGKEREIDREREQWNDEEQFGEDLSEAVDEFPFSKRLFSLGEGDAI